jgi:4-amino-4-deoxy-L-arabinose transferase-like glycosyltransferase
MQVSASERKRFIAATAPCGRKIWRTQPALLYPERVQPRKIVCQDSGEMASVPPSTTAASGKQSLRHSVYFIVLIAFLLRLAVITIGHTYRITPRRDHFQFGWEMGRLARSIALGQGFSSPTDLASGPSAWAAPVYPYVLAGVFRIFGIYSPASAWIILAFNSLFAALTCWTLYRISERIAGKRTARAAAWTWAIFPYLIYWPVRVVWEASLTTFLLSLALWLTISMADGFAPGVVVSSGTRHRDGIALGLLWGLIALTNTTVLILLPFSLLWLTCQLPASSRRISGAAVCVLTIILCVTPWTLRNVRSFGRFIFVRDNLALELHEANNAESSGLWTRSEHPGNDPASMRHFQELGEIGFMDEKRQQVVEFVRENPGTFARFTLERVWYFWAAPPQATIVAGYDLRFARHMTFLLGAVFAFAGLILLLRRKNRYRWLLAPFLLIYPLPYYLVNPFPRYKHPIEPIMLILIVYLLREASAVQMNSGFLRGRVAQSSSIL